MGDPEKLLQMLNYGYKHGINITMDGWKTHEQPGHPGYTTFVRDQLALKSYKDPRAEGPESHATMEVNIIDEDDSSGYIWRPR